MWCIKVLAVTPAREIVGFGQQYSRDTMTWILKPWTRVHKHTDLLKGVSIAQEMLAGFQLRLLIFTSLLSLKNCDCDGIVANTTKQIMVLPIFGVQYATCPLLGAIAGIILA
jgi:hypothetical protein